MTKILIVDDSKVVRMKIKEDLNALEYNDLLFTSNGEDAIKMIKENSVDLIIMDIVLDGEMDGIETSKIINNYESIPTIYLTNDIKNYKRLPAACVYLNKPFTRNELRYNIEIVLEQFFLKKKLHMKIQWFSALFKYSTEGIIMFDENYLINGFNKKYEDIFPYNYEELISQSINDIIISHISFRELKSKFVSNEALEVERELIFNSGASKHFLIKGIPVYNEKKFIGGYLTYIDISVLKRKENKIRYISEHDEMTGLFNRRYFEKKLDEYSKRKDQKISLIIGDIDNLKYINDHYGHSIGDQYIRLASRVLRESLLGDAIIARIGGDEFGIILINQNKKTCDKICNEINKISDVYTKKKNLMEKLSISLGYALENKNKKAGEELFNEADRNMYRKKRLVKKMNKS